MNAASPAPSLDKGSKCPTAVYDLIGPDGEWKGQLSKIPLVPVNHSGTCARLYYRDWDSGYRIRCETETSYLTPPIHAGQRRTKRLADRGKRKIDDSCEYVWKKRGGYSTFLTLTLDAASRARMQDCKPEGPYCSVAWTKKGTPKHNKNVIELGGPETNPLRGTTLQQEVSRFFDSTSKMYQRGWTVPYKIGREKKTRAGNAYITVKWGPFRIEAPKDVVILDIGPGFSRKLDYLWVAENPLNAKNERNPHVHVLLRWRVPRSVFQHWARRLEGIWGQGFAHLEPIKNPKAAGCYMAKAAKYLTKGTAESSDQGPIRGNRYAISKSARAPGWVAVSSWNWGNMAELIWRVRESLRPKIEILRNVRDDAKNQLKELPKSAKHKRRAARAQLNKAREQLANMPAWVGRFQIVFRDFELLDRFLIWATDQGWEHRPRPESLWVHQWRRGRRGARVKRELAKWTYSEENWQHLRKFYSQNEALIPA